MDEADILGDRIAIMAEGRLRCAGGSLFLKKTYGVGYQLTIEKASVKDCKAKQRILLSKSDSDDEIIYDEDFYKDSPPKQMKSPAPSTVADEFSNEEEEIIFERIDSKDDSEKSDSIEDTIKATVFDAVPDAALLTDVGTEISFQLPMGAASQFVPMFEGLDQHVDNGRITSYGISITTLDEVFLLVARGESNERDEYASASAQLGDASHVTNKSSRSRLDLDSEGIWFRHLGALFKKRAANFKRDRKAWVCTTILPSLFVLVGFIIFTLTSRTGNLQPLPLSLSDYNAGFLQSPQNPIAFNAPLQSRYTCQPGVCAYQTPAVFVADPEIEVYFFCGYQGFLFGRQNCSIVESGAIAGRLTGNGASPEPTVVGSILESSLSLSQTASEFGATQYGALFFSHDSTSTVDNGTSYGQLVANECAERPVSYNNVPSCDDFGGVGVVIQYNYTALHAAPLYQTLADEALARQALSSDNFTVGCTIDPLPFTAVEVKVSQSQDAFPAWFLVVLSFPFIAGAFATFVVSERQSKAKHLQTVAGVRPSAYWCSTFLWDVLNYQIPLWITVILMAAFSIEVFTTTTNQAVSGVIMLLFFFGPAAAGFTYCVSFAFTSPSLCNVVVIISGFLIGMGGPLAVFILLLIGNDTGNPQPNLVAASKAVAWILRFTPAFCLGNGLFNVINIDTISLIEGKQVNAWSGSVMLFEFIFLAWQSILYPLLAIQLDKWSTNPNAVSRWRKVKHFFTCKWWQMNNDESRSIALVTLPDDDDVIAEQDRVLSNEAEDELIVIRQLTKVYDTGKVAVNNLSLAIPPGECFGLLGINGTYACRRVFRFLLPLLTYLLFRRRQDDDDGHVDC